MRKFRDRYPDASFGFTLVYLLKITIFLTRIFFWSSVLKYLNPFFALFVSPEVMLQYMKGLIEKLYTLTAEGVQKEYLDPKHLEDWEDLRRL